MTNACATSQRTAARFHRILAVPVAAALGVVARFGVGQYHDSLLYRGTEQPHPTFDEKSE